MPSPPPLYLDLPVCYSRLSLNIPFLEKPFLILETSASDSILTPIAFMVTSSYLPPSFPGFTGLQNEWEF